MGQKKDYSILKLSLWMALAAAPMGIGLLAPKAIVAQSDTPLETVAQSTENTGAAIVRIDGSPNMTQINTLLEQRYRGQFPDANLELGTSGTDAALDALRAGQIDLAAIGRSLTPQETVRGLVEVPLYREKIAIVVGENNPFAESLTSGQFAQIFRGEITDWSEVGGKPGRIRVIDRPEDSDLRQAFRNYPVFQEATFVSGATATSLESDDTDEMVRQLGKDGIGYAIFSQVKDRSDVQIVAMHKTLPDDARYPFSEPFSYVHKADPSPETRAFVEFVSNPVEQEALTTAIASGVAVAPSATLTPETAEGETPAADAEGEPQAETAEGETLAADAEAESQAESPEGETPAADAEAESQAETAEGETPAADAEAESQAETAEGETPEVAAGTTPDADSEDNASADNPEETSEDAAAATNPETAPPETGAIATNAIASEDGETAPAATDADDSSKGRSKPFWLLLLPLGLAAGALWWMMKDSKEAAQGSDFPPTGTVPPDDASIGGTDVNDAAAPMTTDAENVSTSDAASNLTSSVGAGLAAAAAGAALSDEDDRPETSAEDPTEDETPTAAVAPTSTDGIIEDYTPSDTNGNGATNGLAGMGAALAGGAAGIGAALSDAGDRLGSTVDAARDALSGSEGTSDTPTVEETADASGTMTTDTEEEESDSGLSLKGAALAGGAALAAGAAAVGSKIFSDREPAEVTDDTDDTLTLETPEGDMPTVEDGLNLPSDPMTTEIEDDTIPEAEVLETPLIDDETLAPETTEEEDPAVDDGSGLASAMAAGGAALAAGAAAVGSKIFSDREPAEVTDDTDDTLTLETPEGDMPTVEDGLNLPSDPMTTEIEDDTIPEAEVLETPLIDDETLAPETTEEEDPAVDDGSGLASAMAAGGAALAAGVAAMGTKVFGNGEDAEDASEDTQAPVSGGSNTVFPGEIFVNLADFDTGIRQLLPGYEEMLDAIVLGVPTDCRRILDLGTGTGALSLKLLERCPNAQIVGVDYSPRMLRFAQAKIDAAGYDDRWTGVEADFGELAKGATVPEVEEKFDACVSSFAIHHLEDEMKQQLYQWVAQHLVEGGYFWNADPMLAESPALAEKYKALREESARQNGIDLEAVRAKMGQSILQGYSGPDRLATLTRHLEMMTEAGLTSFSVPWKFYGFAVFGGRA